MKFPTEEEFAKNVAEKALDTVEYNGKTLREWIEIIASNDGDTISRKAAIDAVQNRHMMLTKEKTLLINDLEKLPSAQPKRIRGKWIRNGWAITCSECGYDMPYTVRNFCPNCGAKMEV